MNRTIYALALILLLLAVCDTSFAQAQTSNADQWADYVAGDYDIQPNLTYAIANNTELKLDLYLPRDRSAPKPTLILFHGGGWVAGQKERNRFSVFSSAWEDSSE